MTDEFMRIPIPVLNVLSLSGRLSFDVIVPEHDVALWLVFVCALASFLEGVCITWKKCCLYTCYLFHYLISKAGSKAVL